MFTHVTTATPGEIIAIDTHWIWQDGQELSKRPSVTKDGKIKLTEEIISLGIKPDMEKIERVHQLYLDNELNSRGDAVGVQFLVPGRTFDHKRPYLVRP